MSERTVTGVVREQLPSGLYQVEVDGPRRITAHIGGGMERNSSGSSSAIGWKWH